MRTLGRRDPLWAWACAYPLEVFLAAAGEDHAMLERVVSPLPPPHSTPQGPHALRRHLHPLRFPLQILLLLRRRRLPSVESDCTSPLCMRQRGRSARGRKYNVPILPTCVCQRGQVPCTCHEDVGSVRGKKFQKSLPPRVVDAASKVFVTFPDKKEHATVRACPVSLLSSR